MWTSYDSKLIPQSALKTIYMENESATSINFGCFCKEKGVMNHIHQALNVTTLNVYSF